MDMITERPVESFDDLAFDERVMLRQGIKAQLDKKKSEYEESIREMKETLSRLDQSIMDQMLALGVTNMKTAAEPRYTAVISRIEKYEVQDMAMFFDWVKENDAVDVLTRHVSKEGIRSRGEIPDGVSMTVERQLGIRKAT